MTPVKADSQSIADLAERVKAPTIGVVTFLVIVEPKDSILLPTLEIPSPTDFILDPTSSKDDGSSSSSRLKLLRSVWALASACLHLSVWVEFSPNLALDSSSIFEQAATRSSWSLICSFRILRWLLFCSIDFPSESKELLRAFISALSVLVDVIMSFICFLYSASPSMPIFGPMLTAISSPQLNSFLKRHLFLCFLQFGSAVENSKAWDKIEK